MPGSHRLPAYPSEPVRRPANMTVTRVPQTASDDGRVHGEFGRLPGVAFTSGSQHTRSTAADHFVREALPASARPRPRSVFGRTAGFPPLISAADFGFEARSLDPVLRVDGAEFLRLLLTAEAS